MGADELVDDFRKLLEDVVEHPRLLDDVSHYAAERARHLATIESPRELSKALEIEKSNVLLKLGIVAVETADTVDSKIMGLVQGSLFFAAKMLS